MKKFWMVYTTKIGPPPTRCHASLELARAEAKRLAEKHVGETFFVLEATTAFLIIKPEACEFALL